MKYQIYCGSVDNTARPYSIDDPLNEQSYDEWFCVGMGETAEEALQDMIEQSNNEMFNNSNSWLRLKIAN